MNSYVTGNIIKEFREKEKMTQSELADRLMVSNKTVSKWENGKGLPDISLLEPLAKALNVSLIELMSGQTVKNQNVSANMIRGKWYVCPICGNVIHAMGDTVISCCGLTLPEIEVEEDDKEHLMSIQRIEDEYYVSVDHEMTKEHFIGFISYVTDDKLQVVKLYSEQNAEASFRVCGHGYIYYYCNHHGLFRKRV